MAFEFTDANFKETALADGKVAVVDFWAEWCGPCRMIGPIIEDLYKEYDADKVTIGKLNVDHNPNVSMEFGVRSIPTILFFKDGQLVDKQVGVTTKTALENKINGALVPA
ncbi:MAG: thioredoxin [Bacteroidota bacterium]